MTEYNVKHPDVEVKQKTGYPRTNQGKKPRRPVLIEVEKSGSLKISPVCYPQAFTGRKIERRPALHN
jgi:hypothetical protein